MVKAKTCEQANKVLDKLLPDQPAVRQASCGALSFLRRERDNVKGSYRPAANHPWRKGL
jgi:hypothetical protein